MLPKDIIRKIRRIQITTNRLVNESLAGEYHSVFKGRGMEFEDVREYQHGDDIRTIDWNVTSRAGRPFVKRYVEERELTVMLLVDASASGFRAAGIFSHQEQRSSWRTALHRPRGKIHPAAPRRDARPAGRSGSSVS